MFEYEEFSGEADYFNLLSANLTKWSKDELFVFDRFLRLALKGLRRQLQCAFRMIAICMLKTDTISLFSQNICLSDFHHS